MVDESEDTLKKLQTALHVVQEILTTERNYLAILTFLNRDYREHQVYGLTYGQQSYEQTHLVLDILKDLPRIQNLTQRIMEAVRERLNEWDANPTVADIFIKFGNSMRVYTPYVAEYNSKMATIKRARKEDKKFDDWTKQFESEWAQYCRNLPIEAHLCTPIQRLPRYRLLLTEYAKHLNPDTEEYKKTQEAMINIHEINTEIDEMVKEQSTLHKLHSIKNGPTTNFEVFKKGRLWVKDGPLSKISKKCIFPRWIFLFTDVLLCTTQVDERFQAGQSIPILGLKVIEPSPENYPNELTVIGKETSLTLSAKTPEEKKEWLSAIRGTIEEFGKWTAPHMVVHSASCLIAPLYKHFFNELQYDYDFPKAKTAKVNDKQSTEKTSDQSVQHSKDNSSDLTGYLQLFTQGSWGDRWVNLKKSWLYIYADLEGVEEELQIPLKACQVGEIDEWYENGTLQWVFTIGRSHVIRKLFKAQTKEIRERWIIALREASKVS